MIITSLIFNLVSAWFAFLLPAFATYKALSRKDMEAVQNLSMYWCTIGVLVGIEYTCEWFISWLPFYWEVKTLFLLFLALPQTQGSTLVYQSYLEPFFRQNEQQLEQGILSAQSTVVTLVQAKFQVLWEAVWNAINKTPTNGRPGAPSPRQSYQGQPGAAPSPYDTARHLFNTYAPAALGSLMGGASGGAPANTNTKSPTRPSPKPHTSSSSTSFGNGGTPPYQRTPAPGNDGDTPGFPQPRFH